MPGVQGNLTVGISYYDCVLAHSRVWQNSGKQHSCGSMRNLSTLAKIEVLV